MGKFLSKLIGLGIAGTVVLFFLKSQLGPNFLPQLDRFFERANDNPMARKYKAKLNPYFALDDAIRKMPEERGRDLADVVAFIQAHAKTEEEKARAIYIWLAQFVQYDAAAYQAKVYPKGSQEPATVLRERKAVCAGFARTYVEIAKGLGLEAHYISGWVEGLSGKNGKASLEEHAWVSVKVDGQYRLADPTWGQGYVQLNYAGSLVNKRFFKEDWLFVEPSLFIFSHFPKEERWQLQEPKISLETFKRLPDAKAPSYMAALGTEILKRCLAVRGQKPPDFGHIAFPLQVVQAPLTYALSKGQRYPFKLESAFVEEVVLIYRGDTLPFKQHETLFELDFQPNLSGFAVVQAKEAKLRFRTLLTYEVE